MERLCIDASRLQTADDVWTAVLTALGAPASHGRNLDALEDSLRGGDLNAVNAPLTVAVTGVETAGSEARIAVAKIATLIGDLSQDGVPVTWAQS